LARLEQDSDPKIVNARIVRGKGQILGARILDRVQQ
jgi:hypothetical protein